MFCLPHKTQEIEKFHLTFVLLIYNLGDYLGRVLSIYKFRFKPKTSELSILLSVIFRGSFIFWFFRFCNLTGKGDRLSDFQFSFLMLMFSMTGGYFGALAISFAPQKLTKQKDQEAVAGFAFTALSAGLVFGAFLILKKL